MKKRSIISLVCVCLSLSASAGPSDSSLHVEFLGREIRFEPNNGIPAVVNRDVRDVERISGKLEATTAGLLLEMQAIRREKGLCDWLTYQMIRRVSERLAPKQSDYFAYTVTKWHLLKAMGYEPLLGVGGSRVLLYVRTSDRVYNLPIKTAAEKEYVCLNFHDYGFDERVSNLEMDFVHSPTGRGTDFSFAIDRLPDFPESSFVDRDLSFNYGRRTERFQVKTNEALRQFMRNYPVTDYDKQFGIPLSTQTRSTLIEPLKGKLTGLPVEKGVEYLLALTRNAFPFATDTETFGREKRLSAEETLSYGNSDCEDRAALFFCLVREVYNLPMVVLSYPEHVTVAVRLGGRPTNAVLHEGESYTPCEPTPQSRELKVGEMLPELRGKPFEVIHSHRPERR